MNGHDKIRIWDLPLRIFHWFLVLSVFGALITIESGITDLFQFHVYFGYSVFCLIIFRIIWGFIGSYHARFHSFFPTPSRLRLYFKDNEHRVGGHNPLGALSVFAILLIFGLQALSGLSLEIQPYGSEVVAETGFYGPFSTLLPRPILDWLNWYHFNSAPFMYGFIVLHIVAVLFHQIFRRQKLIKAMVTGYKRTYEVPENTRGIRDGLFLRLFGFIVFAAIVATFYFFVVQ